MALTTAHGVAAGTSWSRHADVIVELYGDVDPADLTERELDAVHHNAFRWPPETAA